MVFCGKKGLEAGGGTAASPSTQGREAAAPPAHANLGAMVLATKNTKSAFFSAFSAISAVKNNASEMFVFNRKERKERKDLSIVCFDKITEALAKVSRKVDQDDSRAARRACSESGQRNRVSDPRFDASSARPAPFGTA